MADKLPPQNLEAERSVLGGVLLDNDVLHDVAQILTPDDFYRVAHQTIYRAILGLYSRGITVDAVTLADELIRLGQFKVVGGDETLLEIANSVPHAANTRFHAEIVRQKSIMRQLIQGSTEVIRDGYSNMHTAEQLLESAERKVFTIRERQVTASTLDGPTLARNYREVMRRREAGEVEGLATGFPEIDAALVGLKGKEMIVLAARPGEGKSALAMNIAWNVVRGGVCTMVISLEMSHEEVTERLVGSIASIDTRRLRDTELLMRLGDDEREDRDNAIDQIEHSLIRIDDRPRQTIMQVAANARRAKLRENLGLLVIDYLGYIDGQKMQKETENDVLTRVSRGIKELAKELDIPILTLHQLNRANENEQRRPRKSDLRGSGSIEQDAHVILLLHSMIPEGDASGPVEVIIAKNRNGRTGTVVLDFNKPFTRFQSQALGGQVRAEDRLPAALEETPF